MISSILRLSSGFYRVNPCEQAAPAGGEGQGANVQDKCIEYLGKQDVLIPVEKFVADKDGDRSTQGKIGAKGNGLSFADQTQADSTNPDNTADEASQEAAEEH
jgi:hypothetical protein